MKPVQNCTGFIFFTTHMIYRFLLCMIFQADFVNLNIGYAFLSFGIVLFVWEVLPMFIVIFLFRVRKPSSSRVSVHSKNKKNIKPLYFQNSEYDQDIPQSQTADKPMAPRGRATQQSRDLSSYQDDCKTRRDIK